MDSDAVIAVLSSIFEDTPIDRILHALVRSNYNIDAASDYLISEANKPTDSSKKRQLPIDYFTSHKSKRRLSTNSSNSGPSDCTLNYTPSGPPTIFSSTQHNSNPPQSSHEFLAQESYEVENFSLCEGDEGIEFITETESESHSLESSIAARSVNDVLKWVESISTKRKFTKTITLSEPQLIQENLPCSLFLNFLPPELAGRLLSELLNDSNTWISKDYYLFERKVREPRSGCFYRSKEATEIGDVWYFGEQIKDRRLFPTDMDLANSLISEKVSNEMSFREIHPLAHGIPWKANVVAANLYADASQAVHWHSDSLTNLGPFPTIASLSLGATRQFRLRQIHSDDPENATSQIYSIPLPHNSLLIMWPPCQELYRHAVLSCPPTALQPHPISGTKRINLTFRLFRSEYANPPLCHCRIQAILRVVMDYNSQHRGRYFYSCDGGKVNNGNSCKFFKWLDDINR
ncbi:hypothetical protein BKA69DRAFT_645758 [Paraphysoderma sedebokerense]|nr:hypothetical protein BKA69DRAFT_645758 [Paraphysoderma sedebokerense]